MKQRVRVASLDEIPADSGVEITVAGRVIAVFHVAGKYYAIDGICAHAGGPVGKGELHGCIVTCPWHGWQYDVSNGRHCLTNNISQQSFPTSVEGDDLYVEFPPS
ncbi:MAG: Rieske 2Fe-2S domain-containing protein, partial [Planctomycetaceae bacterium]